MKRPHNIFVCTGPESSGKSTLARALSEQLHATLVEEAARDYLQGNMPADPRDNLQPRLEQSATYQPSDLLAIARQQIQREQQACADGSSIVCDTDLQVVQIWWQEKYGPAPASLSGGYAAQSPRVYLLCAPNLPWVADPLRENPHDRQRLFTLYQRDLEMRQLPFVVIDALGSERLAQASAAVQGAVDG